MSADEDTSGKVSESGASKFMSTFDEADFKFNEFDPYNTPVIQEDIRELIAESVQYFKDLSRFSSIKLKLADPPIDVVRIYRIYEKTDVFDVDVNTENKSSKDIEFYKKNYRKKVIIDSLKRSINGFMKECYPNETITSEFFTIDEERFNNFLKYLAEYLCK